jgi:hypothetical protein
MPVLPSNSTDKPMPEVLDGVGQQAPERGADRATQHSTVDTHRAPPQPAPGGVAPQR